MDDGEPSYMHRWTFDLGSGAVGEQQLDGDSHAFPRVDDRVVGLKHRYGWGVAPRGGGTGVIVDPGTVVKWDFQTGTQQIYDFGPNSFPGEFVFVQDDDNAGEDEGWAMGLVYDQSTETSDLVILDATAPGTDPVARIHLPQRVRSACTAGGSTTPPSEASAVCVAFWVTRSAETVTQTLVGQGWGAA